MKNLVKIMTILWIGLAVFLFFSYTSEVSKKVGMVVEYPLKTMMNPDEEKMLETLFAGDTVVRVRLAETGEIVSAICPAEKITPVGQIVWVSKFCNGGTHMVKQVAKTE